MKVKVIVSTEYEVEIDDKYGVDPDVHYDEIVQAAETAIYNYRLSGKRIPDWEVNSVWSEDYSECLWEEC